MSDGRSTLVSIGESVKVQTVKTADDEMLYWVGDVVAVDDHGIRLTNVQFAALDSAYDGSWFGLDKDLVLTWKVINRITITP